VDDGLGTLPTCICPDLAFAVAARNVNITKEQLDIALIDEDWYVRAVAARNANIV
jgi:hypothetical protein